MSKEISDLLKEVIDWAGDNPYREAWLIENSPIGRSTLTQTKSGSYIPSVRMVYSLIRAKAEYPPNGDQIFRRKKALVS